jgi:excisionase family DNA binding protein
MGTQRIQPASPEVNKADTTPQPQRNILDADISMLPPIMTVSEVSAFLRLGRSVTYELLRQGVIPNVRLGKQIRVSRTALLTYLENANAANEVAANWEV